jgi:pimeloyl-ACP methyl ester carboxylesterase
MSELLPGTTTHRLEINGITMEVQAMGPAEGRPVILLHGFPEFWYSWRHQMPALAEAGFRVYAPDQRGYNRTSKQGPYDGATLTQDIVALQDALGITHSDIVGHDWGAVVAWNFAAHHPERTRRLIILNGPHPEAYQDAMRKGLRQLRKSWYIFLFQIPRLPEKLISANDFGIVRKVFGALPKRYMTEADIRHYIDAMSQPGALTAMINWYRAIPGQLRKRTHPAPTANMETPTCVIWGERDEALDKICNDTLARYVKHLELHYLPNSTHWVQLDDPEGVNRLMLDFLLREE